MMMRIEHYLLLFIVFIQFTILFTKQSSIKTNIHKHHHQHSRVSSNKRSDSDDNNNNNIINDTTTTTSTTTTPVIRDTPVTSLLDQTATFTCNINLDKKNFSASGNYKILWSRETNNGQDYEPLYLDDTRLVFDPRIHANRISIHKPTLQLQWNLYIQNLQLNDSNYYICQLNVEPFDASYLKRFRLEVYAPATFINDFDSESEIQPSDDDLLYVKTVKEYDDFKLKCTAIGKPMPIVSWYLKHLNGSSTHLATNTTEIVIRNIKRQTKFDRIECQASNGIGPSTSRLYKINILYNPQIVTKEKVFRLPVRIKDFKINCSAVSNPLSTVYWLFLPNDVEDQNEHVNLVNGTVDSGSTIDNVIRPSTQNWILLNSHAHYLPHMKTYLSSIVSTNSSLHAQKSKYQIQEKSLQPNAITSILVFQVIEESDFGTYRCLAINSVGNYSVDFKIEEYKHDPNQNELINKHLPHNQIPKVEINSQFSQNDDESEEDNNIENKNYGKLMSNNVNSHNCSQYLKLFSNTMLYTYLLLFIIIFV